MEGQAMTNRLLDAHKEAATAADAATLAKHGPAPWGYYTPPGAFWLAIYDREFDRVLAIRK